MGFHSSGLFIPKYKRDVPEQSLAEPNKEIPIQTESLTDNEAVSIEIEYNSPKRKGLMIHFSQNKLESWIAAYRVF